MTGTQNLLSRRSLLTAGLGATAGGALLGLSGCSTNAGAQGREQIVVAIVSNPQMQDAMGLIDHFHRAYPNIDVRFVSLPENEARAKITASVASGGGEFDVVMISNYETPIWAEQGWLTDLEPYISATDGYRPDDFIATIDQACPVSALRVHTIS